MSDRNAFKGIIPLSSEELYEAKAFAYKSAPVKKELSAFQKRGVVNQIRQIKRILRSAPWNERKAKQVEQLILMGVKPALSQRQWRHLNIVMKEVMDFRYVSPDILEENIPELLRTLVSIERSMR